MCAVKASVKYNDDADLRDIVILQDTIREVAEAAKKLNNSKLKRRAVIVLLHDAIGTRKITKEQINDVLDAAEQLGKTYLK